MTIPSIEMLVTYIPGDDDSLDGRFVYSGSAVRNLEQGTALLLPKGEAGDQCRIVIRVDVETSTPPKLGTAPVEWVGLDRDRLSFLEPKTPDREEIIAVNRIGDYHCEILYQNPGQASINRFLLVLFYEGRLITADPTMINPPDEPPVGPDPDPVAG